MDNDFNFILLKIYVNTEDKDLIDIINTLLDNETIDNINLVKSHDIRYNEKSQDDSDDEEIFIDDEEIFIDAAEYKRVMATLETWLKSNPILRKEKYLEKGIQSTEDYAYAYMFKKVGGVKKYIIIYRQRVL